MIGEHFILWYICYVEITSRNNAFIQELKNKVKDKSLIVLDTPKLISDALSKNIAIQTILSTNKQKNKFQNAIGVSESIIEIFSDVKTNAGVIGLVEAWTRNLKPPEGNFLVLDTVQDPGNVGTLLRSALGANFLDVYLVDCAKISSKVIRSSMGAIFEERVYEISKQDFVKFAQSNNLNLLKADMAGENIFETDIKGSFGVVLGNEGNGVSDEISSLCSKTIKIPMNPKLESLNVGVSGSIIMYEIAYGGKK